MVLVDRDELLRLIVANELATPDHASRSGWGSLYRILDIAKVSFDLSGADLRGANLSEVHLNWVRITLDGANLSGAACVEAQVESLSGVTLDEADARRMEFENLEECSFRKANLEGAEFFSYPGEFIRRCDFTGARLVRARLVGMDCEGVSACTFRGADLSEAEVWLTTFQQSDFREANLSEIDGHRAKFKGCDLRGANLSRADLRQVSFVNADLRKANLTNAAMNEVDLTGARIDGADFNGAVLNGAKLKGVAIDKAKYLRPPVVRVAGPKLLALSAVAAKAAEFETTAQVDLGDGRFARLSLCAINRKGSAGVKAEFTYSRGGKDVESWVAARTFEQGMLNLADRWPSVNLRLDTITAKGGRTKHAELQALAVAAWAEAFGVSATEDDLAGQQEGARHELAALVARMRAEGGPAWNELDVPTRERFKDFSGYDFGGFNLDALKFSGMVLTGCRFQGASLVEAELSSALLLRANLSKANLTGAMLGEADCTETNFAGARLRRALLAKANLSRASLCGANLTEADLTGANLRGADLTDAVLTDAKLKGAEYDPDTKLPAGFKPPPDMIWHGPPKKVKKAKAGSLGFTGFLTRLRKIIDTPRLGRATAMLKKETFQLFAEASDAAVVGVVRSQSDKELVYSCRLASDGAYCCATQNLKPCGGLKGGLCKHLLVLIVGLTKAEQLDAATVATWIEASRSRKAKLEKETLAETFLRYQSAQEGGVDWRPTETVPEDYYAL